MRLTAVSLVSGLAVSMAATPALGAGDVHAGERAFQYCYACHSIDPAETGLPGPNLAGIVGRRIASAAFVYSSALRRFAEREPVWTEDLLDHYVRDPEALVPGTEMSFHGLQKAAERADLIAYLKAAAGKG